MDTIKECGRLLQALCGAAGAGGLKEAGDRAAALLAPYVDDIGTDALGSVCSIRRCGKDNAPLLMIEAHLDEIGLIVTGVEDGFLRVAACGGIDRRVLSAAPVTVWADKAYAGVVCSVPPHLLDKEDKVPKTEAFAIDVGMTDEEAKAHIPPGTRITFEAPFAALTDTLVSAKSLDDRAGCAAVILAMEMLRDEALSFDVAAVLAVQEEIGGTGALTASYAGAPQYAIATDVSFAKTPDVGGKPCGEFGKGPMLGVSPILDESLGQALRRLARDRGISLQTEAMGGRTGTDADSVTTTRGGVRTALLSIPQRYMHTPVEVVDLRDVTDVAALMAAFAKEGFGC